MIQHLAEQKQTLNSHSLDNLLYQADSSFSNRKDESLLTMREHTELIVNLKKELKDHEDWIWHDTTQNNTIENLGALGTLLVFVILAGTIGYVIGNPPASGSVQKDLFLQIINIIFGGVLGFCVGCAPTLWVGKYLEKLKVERWNKSAVGKKVLRRIDSLKKDIEQKEQQMNELVKNTVTQDYFFEQMNQLDTISKEIKSCYPHDFIKYCHENELNLDSIREDLVASYTEQDYHYVVSLVQSLTTLKQSFEKEWQDYAKTDKHALMQQYKEYVSQGANHTQQIKNIL